MNRFIAIDPSTTFTGWAVFQDEGLVAWGVIDTRKDAYADRFVKIVAGIALAYTQYRFQEIVVEDVKFAWGGSNRNRNIAGLQAVFRSLKDYATTSNFPFTAYNPATWKNSVVGDSHASKATTKANICWRFPGLPRNLTEHEYDAVGIGVYHGGILKLETLSERGNQ
jgi:Holliday junction resolvasome RuvABC endonuclease subunit